MYYIDSERIPEAIKQTNRLREWVNGAVPSLAEIAQNAKVMANGEELFKKDAEKMRAITDTAPYRAFVSVTYGGNIWLKADITYPDRYYTDGSGGHSVKYVNVDILLSNNGDMIDFKPLPLMFEGQTSIDMDVLAKLQSQMKQLEDTANKIIWRLKPLEGR